MAAITLKGKVGTVGPVQRVGDNNTEIQFMVLLVPGYTNAFDEKVGKDQQWLLKALGKKVEALKLSETMIGQKAEVQFYAESYCIESKEAGKNDFYPVENLLAAINIVP